MYSYPKKKEKGVTDKMTTTIKPNPPPLIRRSKKKGGGSQWMKRKRGRGEGVGLMSGPIGSVHQVERFEWGILR